MEKVKRRSYSREQLKQKKAARERGKGGGVTRVEGEKDESRRKTTHLGKEKGTTRRKRKSSRRGTRKQNNYRGRKKRRERQQGRRGKQKQSGRMREKLIRKDKGKPEK